MKTRTVTTTAALFLLAALATRAVEWSADLPCFYGGSYDGWSRHGMVQAAGLAGTANVTLSSGMDQTFAWTQPNPSLATVTIEAEDPAGAITNGGVIRISLPPSWLCQFDTGADIVYGGDTETTGRVAAATFSGDGRTLQIPVTDDFLAGDTLTVSGLKLVDLALCRGETQWLELDYDGDGSRDVYDNEELTIAVDWFGGSHDGWDAYPMAEFKKLIPMLGTMITIR